MRLQKGFLVLMFYAHPGPGASLVLENCIPFQSISISEYSVSDHTTQMGLQRPMAFTTTATTPSAHERQ